MKLRILPDSAIKISQVQGNCRSLGRALVDLTIGSVTKRINVHAIEEFSHDLLLGMDAGKAFRMKINADTKTITIKKENKQFVQNISPLED